MGVDFYPCKECGESVCDAGEYGYCESCGFFCPPYGDNPGCGDLKKENGIATCKFCRGEAATNDELLPFVLYQNNITHDKALADYIEWYKTRLSVSIIGGYFGDDDGKRSGWVEKLRNAIRPLCNMEVFWNGGKYSYLNDILNKLPDTGVVIWMADIPNDKPKIVQQIKEKYPKLILVTSKRNLDYKYTLSELMSRALAIKSNLLIEIGGDKNKLEATLLDPLANAYAYKETDIQKLAHVLIRRLEFLSKVQRVGSSKAGEAISVPTNPEFEEFFQIVREQADTFHTIIHGVDTTRMLGNASFRCARGFPSFRYGESIFVSRRNVDKRFIGPDAFVAVQYAMKLMPHIEYFGDNKPSVDTPVQLQLYSIFKNVNYMLHSHTYIQDAPFTKNVVPCGDTEEVWEIVNALNDSRRQEINNACKEGYKPWDFTDDLELPGTHSNHLINMTDFCVNVRGHGSIVFAKTPGYIKNVRWIPRPSPERFNA